MVSEKFSPSFDTNRHIIIKGRTVFCNNRSNGRLNYKSSLQIIFYEMCCFSKKIVYNKK